MDYIIHADGESLSKLTTLFGEVCRSHGVRIGKIRSTLILMAFIDKAREEGLVEDVKNGN